MKPSELFGLVKETFSAWSEDKAPRLGAALAYYTVFSLAPMLLIAIGIAGMVFGEQAARGEILGQIKDTVGEPVARAIEDVLSNAERNGGSGLAAALGLAVLFFGASGVFVQLQDALNTVWKVEPKPGRGWVEMIRDRVVSFTVVLGIGFLLLVSLVASAALSALNKFLTPEALPGDGIFWQAVNTLVSVAFVTMFFAAMYKLLPDVHVAWRDVWIGAAVTALLFTLGKFLLGVYLGRGSTTSAFGAAGSLVVILLWVYYSAQIFLFGAEFTRVYARKRGAVIRPTANAVLVSEEERARQGMPQRGRAEAAASAPPGART